MRYIRNCPHLWGIRNVQIKIIMKYPFHTFRIANIRMVDTQWWWGHRRKEQLFWKAIWQNIGRYKPLDPVIPIHYIPQRNSSTSLWGDVSWHNLWRRELEATRCHDREWVSAGCISWNDKQHWELWTICIYSISLDL